MLNSLFNSIITEGNFTPAIFGEILFAAIVCGLIIAGAYMIKNKYSKSFVVTITLLPSIVALIIVLVNGNIGAGVAVAGAFSLVRFRSAPGRGQEITSIFLAMAVGLVLGMGYLGLAIVFSIIIAGINLILNVTGFGGKENEERVLKIMVPENLDFEERFDDIFTKYLDSYTYDEVKTTNMGSLYKISLKVILKSGSSVKAMMDEIRQRNGNLEISLGRSVTAQETL
ncbi:MAG: DUF4956 domain-containing protein [Eubacterium sp.]|nr:DUF4956 domain-containing protein [Eubacterium sp.]